MVEWLLLEVVMASGGNTWTKKLMAKQRSHGLKVKGVTRPNSINGWDLDDAGKLFRTEPNKVERIREFNAPMKVGFAPRPFGKRQKDRAGLFNAR